MGVGAELRPAGGRRWAAAVGVALLLAGCSSRREVVIGSASSAGVSGPSTGSTAPSAASGEATPQVGQCRGPVDRAIIDAASDPRPTVECSQPHGSETFWVGTMRSTIQDWPGSDERAGAALEQQVHDECGQRHLDYLGLDLTATPTPAPDRLQSFAFFVPTERDFAAGARWFRCDAMVDPVSAETTAIDGTLKDVYAKPLPAEYRLCEARLGQPVSCDQEHELEYLTGASLDALDQLPTQKGDLQVTAACRTPLLEALGLTVERSDLVFGYLLPTQEAWDAGIRSAVCVVGAADGSTMQGTLAGIGPSAALPTG